MTSPDGFEWKRGLLSKVRDVYPYECEEAFFNPLFVAALAGTNQSALGVTDRGRRLFIRFTIKGRKLKVMEAREMNENERSIYEEKAGKGK